MSAIPVVDMQGEKAGTIEFSDDLLALKGGDNVVKNAIVAHRAGLRAGTASTLTKGEVAGSNKKPWRQKGLGRARAGYRQSPIWRGGGVAFGPKPRDYSKKMSKKAARLAFQRVVSDKLAAQALLVVQDFELSDARTRSLVKALQTLNVACPVLIVLEKVESNVALAARNLQGVEVVAASALNTFQVVRYPTMIVSRQALAVIEARLKRSCGKESP